MGDELPEVDMTPSPSTRNLPWMVAGTTSLALLVLLAWHFSPDTSPAQQLAAKASRVDLVGQMQLALASGAEAEKSAVLAVTDEDAQASADQARAAATEVERGLAELGRQLAARGTARERELLASFTDAFAAQQRIDGELLGLAVQNSNSKASALAFGPAADAAGALDAALSRLVERRAGAEGGLTVVRLAADARAGVLRIQALLAPHIAEEDDGRMDRLEATMAQEEERVGRSLQGLGALPGLVGDADLAKATSRFAGFLELQKRILALSRANTDVRSLALSLSKKRRATVLCLEALAALQQAVLDEPIPGVSYGNLPNPRR